MKIETSRCVLRYDEKKKILEVENNENYEYIFSSVSNKKNENISGSIELYGGGHSFIFLEFDYIYETIDKLKIIFENVSSDSYDLNFIENNSYTGKELEIKNEVLNGLFPQMTYETGLYRMHTMNNLSYLYPKVTLRIKKSIISFYYSSFKSILSGLLLIFEIIKLNKFDMSSAKLDEIIDNNNNFIEKFLSNKNNI